MLLLEFLCCKSAPDLTQFRKDESYLVGVWVRQETECEAIDLAVRKLWSHGFTVLRHKGISRWKHKSHTFSRVLNELWDEAERNGISFLVTETSVRLSGSKIRSAGRASNDARGERVPVAAAQKNSFAS